MDNTNSIHDQNDENNKAVFETLQREYRNMESNRRAFADDSNIVLRRQQQSLEKLLAENETLKMDIATMQTKTAFQPVASFERKSINRINSEMDKYSARIEVEKNRINLNEQQIEAIRDQIWQQRRSMGGVNAAQENQRLVEKQVRILENRLEQALVKCNKSSATNKSIRREIDDLRGERLAFENVHRKLEKELQDKKENMGKIIELSNMSYEQRDRALSEISEIKSLNKREREAFEEQIIRIGQILEEDVQAMAAKQANDHVRLLTADSKPIGEKPAQVESLECKLEALKSSTDCVQNYDEAFRKIAAATGIEDVDELVEAFIANEEHNFSLYSYANEQANEIEKLEDEIAILKKENELCKRENGSSDMYFDEVKNGFDSKSKLLQERADSFESKFENLTNLMNEIKHAVKEILSNIGCDSDEFDISQNINDTNIVFYLGLIEKRSNSILSSFDQIRQGNATNGSFTSTSSNILGIGPTAPMENDPINVNPPKITDYSSDEDSCFTDNKTNVRPLTLTELKNRTIARTNRRRSSISDFHKR